MNRPMLRTSLAIGLAASLLATTAGRLIGRPIEEDELAPYRRAALAGGDPARGKNLFDSDEVNCKACHAIGGSERRAGPDLGAVGDKFSREQLAVTVLEPSALVHPDHGTIIVSTKDGKDYSGVLHLRTDKDIQLFDAKGQLTRLPLDQVEQERRVPTSLMPEGLHRTMKPGGFADLIAFLETLKQRDEGGKFPGLPDEIPAIERPIRLVPIHGESEKFDNPVWVVAVPGSPGAYLVVEQKARKVWRLEEGQHGVRKDLFLDLSGEASTGEFEGVVCVAFHPKFPENRRYFVNYHVRDQGSVFSPVIVERRATPDLRRDSGESSRRLLQIPQPTDLHWGGMLAFGPDGYLYIGAGDAGPQEDPDGHSQDKSLLLGSILRIDVDREEGGQPYAIPDSNPYRGAAPPTRPEIWASGFRMPWRFSFDRPTGDLWVGDVGQNLFEEVSIARAGENHGWNVYEGFYKFSERYRRPGETYTPPILAYRRKYGPSVTGGYVYRGTRNSSYQGVYVFGDFESRRIFALTQVDRQLTRVRQIGESPERIASFGVDHAGELLLVGYAGTIFRMVLDESEFPADPTRKVRITPTRDGRPTAARAVLTGGDGRSREPVGAAVRQTSRGESYFYADDSFEVSLPPGRARLTVSGGLESTPATLDIEEGVAEVAAPMANWIDLAARGWYSGDSHVHLHTGGPIGVTMTDALLAARAEGVNYVNLCASNNVGDDIRDADRIDGRPHRASTDRHLLVFGEEMRSTIYGHMQFFGIDRLIEPQYTGFDGTPHRDDFPANFAMAEEATRRGGVVTYGHPLFAGQPFPFGDDPSQPSGAARGLPIDAVLGVVHAVDLMSYNSDEDLSAGLWYRLLNCGLKLSACVGTDALLDRSTDPLGGSRVYAKVDGPLTMRGWLDALKAGRTFVTNGPIPTLEVEGKGPGDTLELAKPGKIHIVATVESRVPFHKVEVIGDGAIAASQEFGEVRADGPKTRRLEFDVPIARSGWVALKVRGPEDPTVFDGPAWAHTSPVYVRVAGQEVRSRRDAEFFVGWIDQMQRAIEARNRFARPEDRRQVEALFQKALDEFRKRAEAQ